MIVYSTGSHKLPTVTVASVGYAGDSLPQAHYVARRLPAVEHARIVGSASVAASAWRALPAYTIVDTHGDGCAAYYAPRLTLVPHLTDWQAECLEAVRHLRRWRYYADTPD